LTTEADINGLFTQVFLSYLKEKNIGMDSQKHHSETINVHKATR